VSNKRDRKKKRNKERKARGTQLPAIIQCIGCDEIVGCSNVFGKVNDCKDCMIQNHCGFRHSPHDYEEELAEGICDNCDSLLALTNRAKKAKEKL